MLTNRTTGQYQKKLAIAHHMAHVGKNPDLLNKLSPVEKEAASQLAQKYPLSPEAQTQMAAGKFNPPKPVMSQPDPNLEQENLSPEQMQAIDAAHRDLHASYPRLLPQPSTVSQPKEPLTE